MPDQNRRDIDEWRLGLEPGEPHHPPPPPPAPAPPKPADLSAARLETPLYVLTVEHLGWAVIALYALLTRLGGLGLRPLSSIEATDALFARDIASRGLSVLSLNPSASGWADPLRAGVFLAFGSGDFGARIIAAVLGLLLIGAAFAMRDRKSTRLNSSHITISYAVFCLKKKKKNCYPHSQKKKKKKKYKIQQ